MSYHTMDALHLVVHLPSRLGSFLAESRQALERTATAVLDRLGRDQARIACSTHHMLAVTHILGLLQEAFPDRLPSTPRYRFDWDLPALCRCRAIATA